ncbi:MAG: hypothetical protein DRJ18_01455 [Candidatus Methanomethylicota archaeon]|nr:MAG: hypothetical protein DRJ18_01455 [Candidatus Verstraetearchaeota archaeon]
MNKGLLVSCCIEAILVVTLIVSVVLLFQPYNIITVCYDVADVQGENIESWQLVGDKLILIMSDGNVRVETIPVAHHIFDPFLTTIAVVTFVIALLMIIPIGIFKEDR